MKFSQFTIKEVNRVSLDFFVDFIIQFVLFDCQLLNMLFPLDCRHGDDLIVTPFAQVNTSVSRFFKDFFSNGRVLGFTTQLCYFSLFLGSSKPSKCQEQLYCFDQCSVHI